MKQKEKWYFEQGLTIACGSSCLYEDEHDLAKEIADALRKAYRRGYNECQQDISSLELIQMSAAVRPKQEKHKTKKKK